MRFNDFRVTAGSVAAGADALAASFGAPPVGSSAGRGWKAMAACSWRVDLGEYEVPEAPETQIAFHTRGAVSAYTEHGWETDRSLPGQVTVIPPRSGSAIRPLRFTAAPRRTRLEVMTVYIPNSTLENLIGDRDLERYLGSVRMRWGFNDAFLAASLAQVAQEILSPREQGSLYADTLADAMALHVLREHTRHLASTKSNGLAPAELRIARDRIEASLCEGVSLDELAREVGFSRYHFARAFKASTGFSPHRYLTLRRVEKAKELLRGSDMSLVEVALAVGFASQAHLCDWFRRLVGISPRQFRRSC